MDKQRNCCPLNFKKQPYWSRLLRCRIWALRFFRLARSASAWRLRRSSVLFSCRLRFFGVVPDGLPALFSVMFSISQHCLRKIMVRALKNFVKGRLQGNKPYGIVRAFTPKI
jgi:hypothetical protein